MPEPPIRSKVSTIRLHPGELFSDGSRFQYTDASNNVLRYNVLTRMDRMVETLDRIGGSGIFVRSPSGNTISDNHIYTDSLVGNNKSGSYLNVDGNWTESQFRANNTWQNNTIVTRDLPAASCGTASLFDGPGTSIPGSPDLLGAPTTITAPSWW